MLRLNHGSDHVGCRYVVMFRDALNASTATLDSLGRSRLAGGLTGEHCMINHDQTGKIYAISFMSPSYHVCIARHAEFRLLDLFVLGSHRAEAKGPSSLSSGTMYRETLGPNFGRVNGQRSTPHDPGETSVEGGVSIEMPLC